jgi:imidazole glycerol phosphate synthase glutamine amidotransferase subunit
MATGTVHLLPTGTANLASVAAAVRRCGGEPVWAPDAATVSRAELLVVPGVGTLAAAMKRLGEMGVMESLVERIRGGRPTLAICLGLQLLAESSEESPEALGLGVWPLRIRRFPGGVRIPQLGWNRVEDSSGWLQPGFAYFANSYCLTEAPSGWQTAWARHGVDFVAAAARGRILACQFHPELSGPWGHDLLAWWLAGGTP